MDHSVIHDAHSRVADRLPKAHAQILQYRVESLDESMARLMAAADSDLASDHVTEIHSDENRDYPWVLNSDASSSHCENTNEFG